MEKYVVFNPNTKEYFKRGYGYTANTKYARLYSRVGDARNSLRRKRLPKYDGWDIYPVDVAFPNDDAAMDTFKAVSDGVPLPFDTVVFYFQQMYQIDISGQCADVFPMSVDLIAAFYRGLRFLAGSGNGDKFVLTEKTLEKEMPLLMMLGSEIIKMFGYETQGRRIALFEIDWFDASGVARKGY